MKTHVLAYLIGGFSFLALDAIWLGVMANLLYRPQLGNLLLEKFLVAPAAAFYLLYPVGITAFAVAPALQAGSALTALGNGLLFGLLAYATYNLTNMSTLRGWSPLVMVADNAWGATATGLAATICFWIMRALFKA